jgi:three-Cys-motif partner protein
VNLPLANRRPHSSTSAAPVRGAASKTAGSTSLITIRGTSDPSYLAPKYRGFPGTLARPIADGLKVSPINPHSLEKLQAVGKYLNGFAQILSKYAVTYIDFYAGPGIVSCRDELSWGSPLMALQCCHRFGQHIFVESDAPAAASLATRSQRLAQRGEDVTILCGRCEDRLSEVLALCPTKQFVLALVDPFRVEFSFESLRTLSTRYKRLDLILLLADGMDLTRNVAQAVASSKNTSARFDRVWGDDSWRRYYDPVKSPRYNASRLREGYVERIRDDLGFPFVDDHYSVHNSKNVSLYSLIHASHHPLGSKLWKGSTAPALPFA